MAHSKEQTEQIETVPDECQTPDFLGKNFKIPILNLLGELKEKWKKIKESEKWCMNKMRLSLKRQNYKKGANEF